MSILANRDTGYGQVQALFVLNSYTPNRDNGTIDGRLRTFISEETRNAYKAAQAQMKTSQGQIDAKNAELSALGVAWDAKNDEQKQADGAAAAYQDAVATARAALNTLKTQMDAAKQAEIANAWKEEVSFRIPAGALVPASPSGVTVDEIYTYLAAHDLSGGTRV